MSTASGDFTAYAVGPYYVSACTSLSDAEATARLNAQHTGVRWAIAREDFANGDPNGRPCNERPETHRHLLFGC